MAGHHTHAGQEQDARLYAVLLAALVAVGLLPWKRLLRGNTNNALLRTANSLSLLSLPVWPFTSLPDLALGATYVIITAAIAATPLSVQVDSNYPLFGYLALGSLSVMTMLPVRNSPIASLLGFSYERSLLWHGLLGSGTVLLAVFHGSLYLFQWTYYDFLYDSITSRKMITYGLAAGGVFAVVLLTSVIPAVRRYSFELFYWIHICSYPAVLVLLFLHTRHSLDFFLPGAIFYALDRLLRIARALRPATIVEARQHGDSLTRLRFRQPSLVGSIGRARPGQFVFIQFPGISPLEWHPFSIVSGHHRLDDLASKSSPSATMPGGVAAKPVGSSDAHQSQDGLIEMAAVATRASEPSTVDEDISLLDKDVYELAIRKYGHFTRRLHQEAQKGMSMTVLVDGPYGRAFDGVMDRDHILLVAGGIGITPLLSILAAAAHRNRKTRQDHGTVGRIELVWTVSQREHLDWFAQELAAAASAGVVMHLYVTSDTADASVGCDDATHQQDSAESDGSKSVDTAMASSQLIAGRRFDVCYSRPSIAEIVHGMSGRLHSSQVVVEGSDKSASAATLSPSPSSSSLPMQAASQNVSVAVCGPRALIESTRTAARHASDAQNLFVVFAESFEI
ncbi:ferric reductase like transmembrane component-domain-containing protein [Entophlyctis helioformis]|nr:ferric reductase like transmembrane component-domain-containing protein [Entophlyctis helioformis]